MGIFGNKGLQNECMQDFRYADVTMSVVATINLVVILLCVRGIIAHQKK
jgi:hypothetical protein